ncbi:MAG: hypothetical protein SO413_04605, partial [Candidatus Cryptobacteroides sp.]|nr:hypothetical protein [Candidatus Cryptobacteroides sp.]
HSASGSIFLRRNVIRPPVPSFSVATTFGLRFHLSPPQRKSSSGSHLSCRKENKKGVAGTVTP